MEKYKLVTFVKNQEQPIEVVGNSKSHCKRILRSKGLQIKAKEVKKVK